MEINHAGNIHPVDVIGSKDRHVMGIGLLNQIDILKDCVCRSLVPGFRFRTHLRRNIGDELALQETAELPPFAQVLEQRLAAELREYINGVDSRIHKIAENEINDSVLSAKGNGWLGALSGQRIEPGPFSSCKHDSQHSAA
jgi:hypothetical protein